MQTIVFNGNYFSKIKHKYLKERALALNRKLKLVSIVFKEDKIGQTYTNLKNVASNQIGFDFESINISFKDSDKNIINIIKTTSANRSINGLLIQKPSKKVWSKHYKGKLTFYDWWEQFTNEINPKIDVDCLTRTNLEALYQGKSDFLPATAKATIDVLKFALKKDDYDNDWGDHIISIVGKSELAGKPLSEKLSQWGAKTYLLGSKDSLEEFLPRSDIIISATGVNNLITGDLIKEGVIIIDLGEPKPDVDFDSIKHKASFITPVPGGVGPVTVVTLLDNLLTINN